jgi:dolichol-phosphate mannosyltransferase
MAWPPARISSRRLPTTFGKFLIVGASGVVVNLGVFTLLLSIGVNRYVASPVAIETSILWNFLLHNYWTFRWRQTKDGVPRKGAKFNLVSILVLLVSYGAFVILSLVLPHVKPHVHQLLSILPATLLNYVLNSYWTFRDVREDSR